MSFICDECPADAKVTAGKPDVGELAFCRHHFNAVAERLFAQGWVVLDHDSGLTIATVAGSVTGPQPIRHRKVRR